MFGLGGWAGFVAFGLGWVVRAPTARAARPSRLDFVAAPVMVIARRVAWTRFPMQSASSEVTAAQSDRPLTVPVTET